MGESPEIPEVQDLEEEDEDDDTSQTSSNEIPLFLQFEKKQEAYKVAEPFKIEEKP